MFVNPSLCYVNDANIQSTSAASAMNLPHPKAGPTHPFSMSPSVSFSCHSVPMAKGKDLAPSRPCQSIVIEYIYLSACPATPSSWKQTHVIVSPTTSYLMELFPMGPATPYLKGKMYLLEVPATPYLRENGVSVRGPCYPVVKGKRRIR